MAQLLTLLLSLFVLDINSLSLKAKTNPLIEKSEISGSLLEMISTSFEAFQTEPLESQNEMSKLINNSQLYNSKYRIFASTPITTNNLIIHSLYNSSTSSKLRLLGLSSLFIFGTFFLLIRSGYNFIKNYDAFFAKGVIALSNQILFLFISFAVFFICFIYGCFDTIYLNWEYLLASISLFILGWVMFCSFVLLISLTIIKKWSTLERLTSSFTVLKDKIKENQHNSELIEAFELLVLKRYFFVPLFPMLKASSLRKDMSFSKYLEYCLNCKLRHFFKISWTSWVSLLMVIMIWNVFLTHASILVETTFILLIPLLGILIMLIVYMYLKIALRKTVAKINNENIHEFKDTDYFSNDLFQSLVYPVYLRKAIDQDNPIESEAKPQNINFSHEHFHQRPPSLYENEFLFGQTTFSLIENILQCCCVIFVSWVIITLSHYTILITKAYSNYALFFIIPLTICYIITQCYVIIITLKWQTIITSIEMKRNEKCVKKLVKYHLKTGGKMAEQIFTQFKKLYYDNKAQLSNSDIQLQKEEEDMNQKQGSVKDFELTYPTLINILKTNYIRFKTNIDEPIIIKDELQPFLKGCGNILSNEEIEFAYHLVDNLSQMNGILYLENFYKICGTILYLRKIKPFDLVKSVFDYYYQQNQNLFEHETEGLKWKNVELFFENHQLYFTNEMINYMKEECSVIGDQFSIDAFITTILSGRNYYAY